MTVGETVKKDVEAVITLVRTMRDNDYNSRPPDKFSLIE